MLTGYCDRLTAEPGSTVTVHVSTDAPFVDLELTRLTGPASGPGRPFELPVQRIDGTRKRVAGTRQRQARIGSFGFADGTVPLPPVVSFAVWVWLAAATPGRLQGILAKRDADRGEGVALALDEEGRPCVLAGDVRLTAGRSLPLRTWCLLAAGFDSRRGELRLSVVPTPRAPGAAEHLRSQVPSETAALASSAPLLLAALGSRVSAGNQLPDVEGLLNGKLERPFICEGLLDAEELKSLAADTMTPQDLPLVHDWDLGHDTDQATAIDLGPAANHLTLVNAPALAATGHRFDGRQLSPTIAPDHYGGAHFHEGDLDDVRWSPTAVLELPESLASGLYAVRLETEAEADHILLCISPRRGASNKVLFLVSTMTMLAYANARVPGLASAPGSLSDDRALNRLFDDHPEWGSSLYDLHSDGSGVSLATTRRPIAGLRPDYWSRVSEEPGLLGSHLSVIEWLDRFGVDYDVISDHDLHTGGAELLAGYRVVISSPHPEYVSAEMLDAITEFQHRGGSFMYLGGNGFYWVTSISPSRPHLMEVRRSYSGSRAWSSEPGEVHHATTGVHGGLWRHRGRPPQAIAGVGTAALGSERSHPGYRSLPAASDPRVGFLFKDIDVPAPGTAVFLDGAAGGETDRVDPQLGTPAHALRIATSEGLHEDTFTLATEDILILEPGLGLGTRDPRVRSDVVFYETGFGGAVFSVGSIAWCSQLPANNYDNDVARVTANVLRRFLDPAPFATDL